MGIMGVLNHAHGGWEDFVEGEQTAHDAPIFHRLLHCFNPGDILCGDRAFCTYELMSTLEGKNVESLMRLHQARPRVLDWRKGKRISKNERLVIWKNPAQQPSGSTLDSDEWEALPREMEIRLMSFKAALDTIGANTSRYLRRQKHVRVIAKIWSNTIEMIAEKVVVFRPDRQEPRAQKKRPKSFSYLTAPRWQYKENPHRGKLRSLA